MPFLARHKSTGQLVTIFAAHCAPTYVVPRDSWPQTDMFLIVDSGQWKWLPQDNFEPCAAWSSGEETREMPQ